MANESDMASDVEQLFLDVSLANARGKSEKGPAYTGECLNCEHPLPSPKRWCDKDCAKDWEDRENAKLRNAGRPLVSSAMFGELDE